MRFIYHILQLTTTSNRLITISGMRKLGCALFDDYRFGRVFFYHKGADSHHGARGFRCAIMV
ncbi:MAG: DUF4256 domain-containing protein [Cryomorphaceae bacterium]